MSEFSRDNVFVKLEKTASSLESHGDFPLVFIMKTKPLDESIYDGEIYVGILDCVEDDKVYLKDTYEICEDDFNYLEDGYRKWDLRREDRDIEEFPHIKLDYVEEIYACRYKITLEQAWNVWSDPRDFIKTENTGYQKIQDVLREHEKNFENSAPFYIDEKGNAVSLKEIFDIESVDGTPVTLIAVTRNQFDTSNFPKFDKYIKMELGYSRCYYGLWRDKDGQKAEYEVVYAIPTGDYKTIQRHLNLHDELNEGKSQQEALVIFPDGRYEPIRNSKGNDKKLNP